MLKREHRRVRCGWEDRIMSNGTWENRNNQSGAVLWLRHSFARAFSRDSLLGDSLLVDCFASLAMTRQYFGGATLVALLLSLRASPLGERGNQQAKNPDTVDCHEASTSTQDYHCAKQAESGVIRVRNKVEQPLARNLRRRGLARGLLAQNNPRLTPRDSRNNLHRLRRVFVDSKLKRARIVLVLHALKQRRIRQERVYLVRNAII